MLVSSSAMLTKAQAGKYAIGQFNINNLEWIKMILEAAQEMRSAVILGVTESAANYMCGLATVRNLAVNMAEWLQIDIPFALHLDHGTESLCQQAIGAGFTSVMFDGSHMPFEENLATCSNLAAFCHMLGISLEAELGSPAGEEDGISGSGEHADPAQCAKLAQSGIDILAASIGNIHGQYPADWKGLDFPLLEKIREATGNLPLALHGGTGISPEMIRHAVELGICKINVNTECQLAFATAIREYVERGNDLQAKGYGMQKLLGFASGAIKEKVKEKIALFGSEGSA